MILKYGNLGNGLPAAHPAAQAGDRSTVISERRTVSAEYTPAVFTPSAARTSVPEQRGDYTPTVAVYTPPVYPADYTPSLAPMYYTPSAAMPPTGPPLVSYPSGGGGGGAGGGRYVIPQLPEEVPADLPQAAAAPQGRSWLLWVLGAVAVWYLFLGDGEGSEA